MSAKALSIITVSLALLPVLGHAAVEKRGEAFVVTGAAYTVSFSAQNGSILSVGATGKTGSIWQSGERGLWSIRFADNSQIDAASFSAADPARKFACVPDPAGNQLRMTYTSPAITVSLTVKGLPDGIDIIGESAPVDKTVLDLAVPGRLRFDPALVDRFVCPMNGNTGVGAAFKSAFFRLQPQDNVTGWRPEVSGPAGYVALYGGGLVQRADQDPATALQVTAEARQWLPDSLSARLAGATAAVNRPPTRAQADLILVDSANGPYLSASHLGGTGLIWRIGGAVGDPEKQNALDMVVAVVDKLIASAPPGRTKLGLVSLKHGPERGSWGEVAVADWRSRFSGIANASRGKVTLVELTSAREMLDAANAGDFLTILNPYGEWVPVPEAASASEGVAATAAAVGRFVRAGGNWFEVGGYPFFYAMTPLRYLSYSTPYPSGFADFMHLDSAAGSASLYRVQPQSAQPWVGAQDHAAIFVPGSLGCGGDARSGYCDRTFSTYVPAGQTWRAPTVRLTVGKSAPEDLAAYCAANKISRGLADKVQGPTLGKLKQSVLVYYAGNCRDKTESLPRLPVPTLIHFADYLHGGFDKQYPDHLPPNPAFGTPEEFRAFFDRAHALGHLVYPYTNPTWWCDHPKGPTFEREGDAPLLKGLDGKPAYERYAANDGWTITFWHPAVRAANRKTVRQFTDEYPVDVLFQDQCGARGWGYDTNPASPTPYAYSDGLISMVQEDCKTKPLGTECGWDRVVNYETQLCGMTWGIVPTEGRPSWSRLVKSDIPPNTWEIYPLAEYIAHDKTMMLHHDLGQFVMNDETLAWTLGLGFSLSYTTGATALNEDANREWLNWLARLQKSVCARYIGEPVRAFSHDRGPALSGSDQEQMADDGIIRATYGPVSLSANLGPKARNIAGRNLAPYGFYATGPGLTAGHLTGAAFVTQGDATKAEAWVYSLPDAEVAVPVPAGMTGKISVAVDGSPVGIRTSVEAGAMSLRLPSKAGRKRVAPPVALAAKAPREWPGARPAIGVLDFGPGLNPTWTGILPAQWVDALQQSPLATQDGLVVKRIASFDELAAALKSGPQAWLAIVNPYGELFPEAGPGQWRGAIDLIHDYVNHGGCWWEAAGYSFHVAFYRDGEQWRTEVVGPGGMGYLGLPIGGGDVEQAPEALHATPAGVEWLGADLAAPVGKLQSPVNRGVPTRDASPAVVLVAGADMGFIGGYRLDGWGWLWRVGGFNPDPQVVLPVATAALSYVYAHPPVPPAAAGVRSLWHLMMRKG